MRWTSNSRAAYRRGSFQFVGTVREPRDWESVAPFLIRHRHNGVVFRLTRRTGTTWARGKAFERFMAELAHVGEGGKALGHEELARSRQDAVLMMLHWHGLVALLGDEGDRDAGDGERAPF